MLYWVSRAKLNLGVTLLLTLQGMSDPDFNSSAIPDPAKPTTAAQRQMQQDELYARQLAQHYQTAQGPRRTPNEPPLPARPQSDHDRLYGGSERERNFFDGMFQIQ